MEIKGKRTKHNLAWARTQFSSSMLIYVARCYFLWIYIFHLTVFVPCCIHWPFIWLWFFFLKKNIFFISENCDNPFQPCFHVSSYCYFQKRKYSLHPATVPPFLISRAGTSSSSVNTVPSDKAAGNIKDERGWYECTWLMLAGLPVLLLDALELQVTLAHAHISICLIIVESFG